MCLHPGFEVSTTAKISQGEWGLATSKHLRSNCLPASGSYQILRTQGALEFIQCILHFTGKGAEVKAQRIGTKAQPKVRFCLPKVTICSQKTRKATKATLWPSTLSHLSRAVPPRVLGCSVCAWAHLIGECLAMGPLFILEPTGNVLQASVERFGSNVRK